VHFFLQALFSLLACGVFAKENADEHERDLHVLYQICRIFSHPSLDGVQKTLVVQKLKVKQCNATTQTHLVTLAKFFLRIHRESF
jgi:hypothetical protein